MNTSLTDKACLRRWRHWVGGLALWCGLAGVAQAQWLTQSFTLKPGWNAVYLHVDASHVTVDELITGDAGNPISEIWFWQPNEAVLYDAIETTTTSSQWLNWSLTEGISETLNRLVGNAAYLVRNDGQSDFTWNVKGQPVPFQFNWTVNGANFVGFPTPTVNPPIFDNLLNLFPELYTDALEIYYR